MLNKYFIWFLAICLSTQAYAQKGAAKESVKEAERQINTKDYKGAKINLQNAIRQKDNFSIAYRLLGIVNSRMGEYEEAVQAYEKLFKLDPELSKAAYFEAGQACMKIYEYDKALRYFETFKTGDDRDFQTDEQTVQRGYELLVGREMNSCRFARQVDFSQPLENPAEDMGSVINTEGDEYLPTLTSDGKLLVFTSDRAGENIMVARRKEDGTWTNAKSIGKEINTPFNEGMAKLTVCGRTLYFAACGWEQGQGGCDIFKASFDYEDASGYGVSPVKELSTKKWDSQPTISCDGTRMYFASNRDGGYGGTDIWASTLTEAGIWSVPVNMGASVNTNGDEEAPYIAPDGVTLYFSSDGHAGFGEMDIFRTVRNAETNQWSMAKNLGRAFNTPFREAGLVVSPENDIAYFGSARPKGKGGIDIYQIKLPKEAAPENDNVLIDGFVFDAQTGEPVSVVIAKIGTSSSRQTIKSDSAGRFFICLPNKASYSYIIQKEGYEDHIGAEFFQRLPGKPAQRIEVALSPKGSKKEVKVDPNPVNPNNRIRKNLSVYFESGKHDLTDIQREQIRQLFTQFPDKSKIQVKVTGFADDVGNKDFNLSLSEKRASFVAQFIQNQQVPIDKIIYDGKGVVEANIAKHQKRKVEIIISTIP